MTAREFTEKCEAYLEQGIDILYVACTDALSGTRAVFELVKRDLKKSIQKEQFCLLTHVALKWP